MSERIYFEPAIGAILTPLGLSSATDDWGNAWSGRMITCQNQPPSPMSIQELVLVHGAMHPFGNPSAIVSSVSEGRIPYLDSGEVNLGEIGSPLQTICMQRSGSIPER